MKKKLFFIILGIAIAGVSIWFIVYGGKDETTANDTATTNSQQSDATTQEQKDSLDSILKKQKQIKIFNELLVEADVVTTLQGQGPYTVLAPTDDAFKALPEGLLDTLKKPENKDNLRKLMQYHIVKGNLSAESLQNGQKLPTVNGQEIIIEISDGKTSFVDAKGNKALIKTADVAASNGTIHIITAVLLPQ